MEQTIKIVYDEPFCDLVNYLKGMQEDADFNYPLAFVNIEGVDYAIIRSLPTLGNDNVRTFDNGEGYVISCLEKDKTKSFLAGFKQGDFTVFDGEYIYYLGENCTQRVDTDGEVYESLFCGNTIYPDIERAFEYRQVCVNDNLGLFMFYPILNNTSPEIFINYLGDKDPHIIHVEKSKSLFSKKTDYLLLDNQYNQFRVTKANPHISKFRRPYPIEEMREIITSEDLNMRVPEELIKVYKKTNTHFNNVITSVEMYKNNTSY